MIKTAINIILSIVLFVQAGCTQSKAVNGVYAGVELTLSTMMGGGMNRNDVVIFFRPDGTFNDDLSKPDWQTIVSGRYTVNGRDVSLHRSGEKEPTVYQLDSDGNLDGGSFNLIKQPLDSSIPKGYFEFSSASGSGGMGSGMAYVGSSSNKGLYFDGKGGFSNNSQSATVISGESIGGGGSRKSDGNGTYKISKGLLTLTYSDGRTETHSFFSRPDYDPVMAVVDGDIYFMKDGKKTGSGTITRNNSERRNSSVETDRRRAPGDNDAMNTADGKSLLLKANKAHGGISLDDVQSLKFTADIQGLQATGFTDILANRVRIEIHQQGKLVLIEQVDHKTGWRWRAGKTTELPDERAAELSGTFSSGILGLRTSVIQSAIVKSVKPAGSGYAIVCEQDGQQHAFLLDNQSRLLATVDKSGATPVSSVYSDLKLVSKILLPFGEVTTSGNQKVSVKYLDFVINPSLSESTWAKP